MVQFEGPDAAPVRCWGTPGGCPQAVLYPPHAGGGVVVVTHDRRLVAAGWSADSELPAAEDVNGVALMSVDVAGGALKAFAELAPHKGTLKADGAAMASAVVGRCRGYQFSCLGFQV